MLYLNDEEIYICKKFINKPITIKDINKLKEVLKGYTTIQLSKEEQGESEEILKEVMKKLLKKLEVDNIIDELSKINFDRDIIFDN